MVLLVYGCIGKLLNSNHYQNICVTAYSADNGK
jgi:hypothetical protein